MTVNLWGYMPILFNMSITGGIIILVVLLTRLCLKKAPKIFSYVLWIVVLVRLLCPVAVSTPFSVLNLFSQKSVKAGRMEYIPERATKADHPFQPLTMPVPEIDEAEGETIPPDNFKSKLYSVNAMEIYMLAAFIWVIGACAMLIYSNVQFVWLKEKLVGAMPVYDNIYLADHIDSPFVLGMIKPKIYLPSSLSDTERGYIILHEQHHIKRFDHITRIIAYLALCVHWFNPLVWVAFVLSGTDMEMSCDEAVMKNIGEDIRESYSRSLISLATGRRIISGTPLAFGEGCTKSRIKNVMKYKKPAFWVLVLAVAACIITSGCVLTNPAERDDTDVVTESGGVTGTDSATGYDADDEIVYLPAETITETPNTANTSDKSSQHLYKELGVIEDAIIQHNYSRSLYTEEYNVPCACFVTLSEERTGINSQDTPESADEDSLKDAAEIVTYYGLALYEQFKVSDNDIESGSASYGPVALTFKIDDAGEYELSEYWEPSDGSNYMGDIRKKFPAEIIDEALDSQKYILIQELECYKQAIIETGADANMVMEKFAQKFPGSYDLLNQLGYLGTNTTTDHVYILGADDLDDSVVHVASLGYANKHGDYYFFYKENELFKVRYMASIQGTPDALEARNKAENYSGVVLTDQKEGDNVYVLFEIDMLRDGKKYLKENHPIFKDQDDWAWKAVKKTLEENGYACDIGFDREMTAYIKGLMGEYIMLDEVEWVPVPSKRAKELNITDKDAPDGFYIYDENFGANVYAISNSCKITAIDLRMNSGNMIEMPLDRFTDMFSEVGDFKEDMVFNIKIENGEVVEIMQRYLP